MDNSNWQYEYEVEHFRLEKAQAEIKELRDAEIEELIEKQQAEIKELRDALEYYRNLIMCHAGSCDKCKHIAEHIHIILKDGE